MTLLSNKELLKRIPLFSSLSNNQLSILENAFVKKKIRRNYLIFKQGQHSDSFFVVLVGRAHIVTTDEKNREVILAILEQGDYFGEMSLIDGNPHSASVKAVVPTEILMLERQAFESCMPAPESLPYRIMLSLVQRLRAADKKIESLALLKGQDRIIQFLKEITCVADDGSRVIHAKISASYIGKNVGASREMSSRVLKKLKADGLIVEQPDGSHIMSRI
ncbi:Crp/Fnr family transcriptional regulator [Pseudomonas sp.]|uniref:Crp/Fnr family transcriptional regulator n=1 Tax=Pseudomonas sp. TaxID=306 RepID=UPI0025DF6589|nr:Crp/Fnr family transcriptional regulator [Pseudomonas sp.]